VAAARSAWCGDSGSRVSIVILIPYCVAIHLVFYSIDYNTIVVSTGRLDDIIVEKLILY